MSEDLIARLRERNVLVEDKQVGTLIGLDGVESPIMSGSVTTLYNRDGEEAAARITQLTEALDLAIRHIDSLATACANDGTLLGKERAKSIDAIVLPPLRAALSETNKGGAGE